MRRDEVEPDMRLLWQPRKGGAVREVVVDSVQEHSAIVWVLRAGGRGRYASAWLKHLRPKSPAEVQAAVERQVDEWAWMLGEGA